MLITDKNFSIISTFVQKTDLDEPFDEAGLWTLSDRLEDMSCLFRIARVVSCILKCICLDGWYLNQVKEVCNEFSVCLLKGPARKLFVDGVMNDDVKQDVKKVTDFQEQLDATAIRFANVSPSLVQQAQQELFMQDISSIHDVFAALFSIIRKKEIDRVKGVLISEGELPQLVEIAITSVGEQNINSIERDMREEVESLKELMPVRQREWKDMTKGLSKEHLEIFAKDSRFATLFTGLEAVTNENWHEFKQASHQLSVDEIIKKLPRSDERAIMAEAGREWLAIMSGSILLFDPYEIGKALGRRYMEIQENIPQLKAAWAEKFEGNPIMGKFVEECCASSRFKPFSEGIRSPEEEDFEDLELRFKLDQALQSIVLFEKCMDRTSRLILAKNREFLRASENIPKTASDAMYHIQTIATALGQLPEHDEEDVYSSVIVRTVVNTLMRMTSLQQVEQGAFTSFAQHFPLDSGERIEGAREVHYVLRDDPNMSAHQKRCHQVMMQFYLTFGLIRGCNASAQETFFAEKGGIHFVYDTAQNADFIMSNYTKSVFEDANESDAPAMCAMSFIQSTFPYSEVVMRLFAWSGLKEKITGELEQRGVAYKKDALEERLDRIVEIFSIESMRAIPSLTPRDLFFMIFGQDFKYHKYKEKGYSDFTFFNQGIHADDDKFPLVPFVNNGSSLDCNLERIGIQGACAAGFPMPKVDERYPCQKVLQALKQALHERNAFETPLFCPESFNVDGWNVYKDSKWFSKVLSFMLAHFLKGYDKRFVRIVSAMYPTCSLTVEQRDGQYILKITTPTELGGLDFASGSQNEEGKLEGKYSDV